MPDRGICHRTGRVNKAYNRDLVTRQSGGLWAIQPAAVQITFIHTAVKSLLKCNCTCQLHVNLAAG